MALVTPATNGSLIQELERGNLDNESYFTDRFIQRLPLCGRNW